MISLSLYAFTTGLYFALMQFSFFLMLQINISSTYMTYMIVVIAWMTGSVTGLWLKQHSTIYYIIGGLAFYYLSYLLVTHDPLAMTTLTIAGFSVWINGLWAGQFFIVMLPAFRRMDTLFFHENNGFLLGVVLIFIGFTLLGRGFLVWAPLVTAIATVSLHYAVNKKIKQIQIMA